MAVAAEVRWIKPAMWGGLHGLDVIDVEGWGATLDAAGMCFQVVGANAAPVRVVTATMRGAALTFDGRGVRPAIATVRGASGAARLPAR